VPTGFRVGESAPCCSDNPTSVHFAEVDNAGTRRRRPGKSLIASPIPWS
jgi:hypothetical protein